MGVQEDCDEFNNSGLHRVLKSIMTSKDEGFIKILNGGRRGVEVFERPEPGSGRYLYFKRGYPVLRYSNASVCGASYVEFKFPV